MTHPDISDHIPDPGIRRYVAILAAEGVETFESCQAGEGHCFPCPTVRFHGDRSEGFRALAVAVRNQLPVESLRRYWTIIDGEPTGPHWEMTFYEADPSDERLPMSAEAGCPCQAVAPGPPRPDVGP